MTRQEKIKALQAITTGQANIESLMPKETFIFYGMDETPESRQATREKIDRINERNKHRIPDTQHVIINVIWPEGE
jgi:hypothetical protein